MIDTWQYGAENQDFIMQNLERGARRSISPSVVVHGLDLFVYLLV